MTSIPQQARNQVVVLLIESEFEQVQKVPSQQDTATGREKEELLIFKQTEQDFNKGLVLSYI